MGIFTSILGFMAMFMPYRAVRSVLMLIGILVMAGGLLRLLAFGVPECIANGWGAGFCFSPRKGPGNRFPVNFRNHGKVVAIGGRVA